MTDNELVAYVKALNDVKFETADAIKRLIYKYGTEDTLPYIGDCIVIRRETIEVILIFWHRKWKLKMKTSSGTNRKMKKMTIYKTSKTTHEKGAASVPLRSSDELLTSRR
jgi:hypothetical protein